MRWFYRRGLRVLMYHRVAVNRADALTVTVEQLRWQIDWLHHEGFCFVSVAQVLAAHRVGRLLGGNSLLLTFDDAYRDTLTEALPVLRAAGVPAVVFVPTGFIGLTSAWDREAHPLMNGDELAEVAAAGVELALHSHGHRNFRTLTVGQISADVRQCQQALSGLGLHPVPALAYPYGGRPGGRMRYEMERALRAEGVELAFRIGNRINPPALGNPFAVNRLGIRGDADEAAFRRKLAWGRWW